LLLWLGWPVAIAAAGAAFVMFQMFLEMRAKDRLTSVQLPVPAQITTTENWDAAPRRIMLVGESRIRRWTALPEAAELAFAKSGVGGETLGQLERRFDENVLEYAPIPTDLVFAIGVNDLVAASLYHERGEGFQSHVVSTLITRLEGLIAKARAAGVEVHLATIVQAATPDLTRKLIFWDESLVTMISEANRQIAELADREGLALVDFNAMLEGGDGPLPARFAADTLHFTPAAYDALNAGLLRDFAPQ